MSSMGEVQNFRARTELRVQSALFAGEEPKEAGVGRGRPPSLVPCPLITVPLIGSL